MTLKQFVLNKIENINGFDTETSNCIKKVIRSTIKDFEFRSVVKVEETEAGRCEILYLASAVEEKLLSKIAEFAIGTEEETSIESIYEGYVVRNY
ncbi:MAG: DUF6407 family protein [Anaerobacillus sp.]|uniref:DUF6407 family protein n=1 Tax=Anaerobacillus sp. TaxID=1872506 RepID=UPI00391BDAEF